MRALRQVLVVTGTSLLLVGTAGAAQAAPPVGGCPGDQFELMTRAQILDLATMLFGPADAPSAVDYVFRYERNGDGKLCVQLKGQKDPSDPRSYNFIDNVARS